MSQSTSLNPLSDRFTRWMFIIYLVFSVGFVGLINHTLLQSAQQYSHQMLSLPDSTPLNLDPALSARHQEVLSWQYMTPARTHRSNQVFSDTQVVIAGTDEKLMTYFGDTLQLQMHAATNYVWKATGLFASLPWVWLLLAFIGNAARARKAQSKQG